MNSPLRRAARGCSAEAGRACSLRLDPGRGPARGSRAAAVRCARAAARVHVAGRGDVGHGAGQAAGRDRRGRSRSPSTCRPAPSSRTRTGCCCRTRRARRSPCWRSPTARSTAPARPPDGPAAWSGWRPGDRAPAARARPVPRTCGARPPRSGRSSAAPRCSPTPPARRCTVTPDRPAQARGQPAEGPAAAAAAGGRAGRDRDPTRRAGPHGAGRGAAACRPAPWSSRCRSAVRAAGPATSWRCGPWWRPPTGRRTCWRTSRWSTAGQARMRPAPVIPVLSPGDWAYDPAAEVWRPLALIEAGTERRPTSPPASSATCWTAASRDTGVVHPARGGRRNCAGPGRPAVERGLVVFLTGLSGSGKSTLARDLRDALSERGDRTVSLLDGDLVRLAAVGRADVLPGRPGPEHRPDRLRGHRDRPARRDRDLRADRAVRARPGARSGGRSRRSATSC